MKPTLQLVIAILLSLPQFIGVSKHLSKVKKEISCSEFTDKYVDQVTGIKRFIAKEKISLRDYKGKNSFDLVWFKTKEEYTLAFKASKRLCFQNDVAVSFHLLQGKVVTCPSAHIANCESLMTINFQETEEGKRKLDLLTESEVVGISFENDEQEFKLKLRPNHAKNFQQTIECLKTKK